MIAKKLKTGLVLLLFVIGLNGCVNLKSVNNYSSSSSKGIKKFEEINYSFSRHCIDKCQFEAIRNFEIKRDIECDCDGYKKADRVTLLIYNSIKGYFDGLTNLSNNDLTDYNFDALNKSLTKGDFGDIKIEKEQEEAYSKISKILLKATTDVYRKKKLKIYIEEANDPLQILLKKFQFITQKNLEDELKFKKERLYAYYKEMNLNNTLSDYEKGKATMDYYQQLSDINSKQKQIDAFAKSLKAIADGHQKLYDNRNKITAKELKGLLTQYASDIQDLNSEFNKLK
jgi:hypothetical protein